MVHNELKQNRCNSAIIYFSEFKSIQKPATGKEICSYNARQGASDSGISSGITFKYTSFLASYTPLVVPVLSPFKSTCQWNLNRTNYEKNDIIFSKLYHKGI